MCDIDNEVCESGDDGGGGGPSGEIALNEDFVLRVYNIYWLVECE